MWLAESISLRIENFVPEQWPGGEKGEICLKFSSRNGYLAFWVRRVGERKYFCYHGESSSVFAGLFSGWRLNYGDAQGCWTLVSAAGQSVVLKTPRSWLWSLYRPFTQGLDSMILAGRCHLWMLCDSRAFALKFWGLCAEGFLWNRGFKLFCGWKWTLVANLLFNVTSITV